MNSGTSTIGLSFQPKPRFLTHTLLTLALVLWSAISAFAQVKTTASVFTKGGEKFRVYVDGVRYNEKLKARVEVKDLSPTVRYRFRIVFENTRIPSIDQNVYTTGANGPVNLEYVISKKKGKYVMKLNSSTKAAQASSTANTSTTTTTTTTSSTGSGTSTTTTTTTTTTSSDTETGNTNTGNRNRRERHRTHTNTNSNDKTVENCTNSMTAAEFDQCLNSIRKQNFADDKLKVARQIVKGKCVTAEQVKKMMGEFSFESNKLDLAKFAYDYTTDQDNYFIVNDAFGFSSSVDELNNYLDRK